MGKTGKILIIDDNRELLIALRICLEPHFQVVDTLYDPNRIRNTLQKNYYDLVLLDMNFSPGQTTGNEGLYWLRKIKEHDPNTGVVFITAYGDVALAVRSVREGAIDFILKSWDESKIISTVLSALKIIESGRKIDSLKVKGRQLNDDISKDYRFHTCHSESMSRIMDMVKRVAPTEANVLLLGENGTGKELIAREIHRLSERSDDIFVKVDMGSITDSLFESELFGYRKGAFTDAKQDRAGRIEVASGGTLFLDEIGNLNQGMQAKMLSVLQNKEIVRLGDSRPVKVDIRVVSATNCDIRHEVSQQNFREDLFYRLNTIIIELPPLRERKEDISSLAKLFLEEFNSKYSKSLKFSEDATRYMLMHNWPGNVRELRHIVEKGVILAGGKMIKRADLEYGNKTITPKPTDTFNLALNEKQVIERALTKFHGNISRTSKELGINRSTLYEKIEKYEISIRPANPG
jgi:two-component system, NtrC family, response regulator HydG